MLLGVLVVVGGISVALGLGLPKIATSQIQDMVWMVMVGFQVWLNYKGVSSVLMVRNALHRKGATDDYIVS
jgi:glycosylphosphatidylinositol transamidase (GPIT) subunit GPI8